MDAKKLLKGKYRRKETTIPTWTIEEQFGKVVEQNSKKTAIITFSEQQKNTVLTEGNVKSPLCFCYVINRYIIIRPIDSEKWMLISSENFRIVLDATAYQIFQLFDGDTSLWEINKQFKNVSWNCSTVDIETEASVATKINCDLSFSSARGLNQFALLLQQQGFLVLQKIKLQYIPKQDDCLSYNIKRSTWQLSTANINTGKILLLGDKPGTATVGILYLTSYLRQHGVEAKCMYTNSQYQYSEFCNFLKALLKKMCPDFVAISMKWFPHIERVYEIGRMIKLFNENIQIIVGGDTASYYAQQIILEPAVDYVICGDGEVPLLKICRGEQDMPNTYYKSNNTVNTPHSYVTNTRESTYSLLPLEEIVIDPMMAACTTLYLPTSKGCEYNCMQCGGSKKIQIESLHRTPYVVTRPVAIVRQDILNTYKQIPVYMFSICNVSKESEKYYAKIWDGINLTDHFCVFFSTTVFNEDLVVRTVNTFRYVRFGIDLCSLSQRHREKVNEQSLGKPQITDEELFAFMDICENYQNCEVDIYTIAGMPLFEESDMEAEVATLNRLMKYKCFHGIDWGRLHAQPGAEISKDADKYQMHSAASTYESFHLHSKMNQEEQNAYPDVQSYHYPYVTYKEEKKDNRVLMHYLKMSEKCGNHKKKKNDHKMIRKEISYHSLDLLSDQLAQRLINQGLRFGDNVILFFEDRINLSIAIIAVIKAGGCYIPLDTIFHAEDLTQLSGNMQVFGTLTDINAVCSNNCLEFYSMFDAQPSDARFPHKKKESLLYRIYTSGSSGKAKCISIRQAGIINYVSWRIANYRITTDDIILQLLSEAFDGFGSNFYTALLSGACLIMPPPIKNRDIPWIKSICREYNVTHTSILPFHLDLLLQNDQNSLTAMRSMVLAGDTCSSELIQRTNELYPDLLLINEYGPTEGSIAVAAHIGMDKENPAKVGKAISNVSITIVNEQGNPVQNGELGEICIGGIGLFAGYSHTNATSCDSLAEYKTGDIGWFDKEDDLVFVGRNERTIKSAGVLVSLDFIEKMFRSESSVIDVAIMLHQNVLHVFVVIVPNTNLQLLKQFITEKLPSYAQPKLYHELTSLPRQLSGKIDYQELLSTITYKKNVENELTSSEFFLFCLWEEELGHQNFSIEENFFDIGGNSLMMMRIYNKLNEVYPDILSITDLFTYHSIRQLAEYIDGKKGTECTNFTKSF